MKKRIMSSLLVICMLFALMPGTAFAAAEIDEVTLTITAPEVGKTPATTATLEAGNDCYVKSVTWTGALDNGKFKAGVEYTANITLGTKNDAKFSNTVFDATVNGTLIDAATLIRSSDTELIVPVMYGKLSGTTPIVLTEATLTITAPEVGKAPSSKATLKESDNCYVKSVKWTGSLDNAKFKTGVEYTALITLGTKNGAKFSDTVFDATVNGTLIDAKTLKRNSDTELVIPVIYEALGTTPTVLTEATLTITAPEVGKTPSTNATLKAGSGCYVKSVKWTGTLSSGKFKAGVAYTANITLGIRSGYNVKFSDKVFDATVNGTLIDAKTLKRNSDTELVIPVMYEKLAAASKTSVLKQADITLAVPVIGKTPTKTANVGSNEKYYVKSVTWVGELNNGKFKAGVAYTANIILGIKDSVDAKFSDSTFNAVVNKQTIDASTLTRVSDKELLVPVMYERLADNTVKKPTQVGGFSDVLSTDYFADPVLWAVDKKITTGTGKGKFSPVVNCSQAEILTFLWRAAGSPKPQGTVQMEGFTGKEYYYQAAQWALEKDMIPEGEFDPDAPCTRSMAVMFMWKHAGSPSAVSSNFSDIPSDSAYAPAVSWAVSKGVTNGVGNNNFAPKTVCTRSQIVTFLYRGFAG